MPKPPLILITTSLQVQGGNPEDSFCKLWVDYAACVRAVGAVPVLMPCLPDADYVAELVARCDGVMLTGGDDVDPGLYRRGKLVPGLASTVEGVERRRDLAELLVVEQVFRQQKPLLAICRGLQLLNVALGGTLLVDIPQEVPGAMNHSRSDRKRELVHGIRIKSGSLLAKLVSSLRVGVNSSHHQAVKKVAKPLQINAVSKDGIVEGLELAPNARKYLPFLLAVQFHPERLAQRHKKHEAIFGGFAEACCRSRISL